MKTMMTKLKSFTETQVKILFQSMHVKDGIPVPMLICQGKDLNKIEAFLLHELLGITDSTQRAKYLGQLGIRHGTEGKKPQRALLAFFAWQAKKSEGKNYTPAKDKVNRLEVMAIVALDIKANQCMTSIPTGRSPWDAEQETTNFPNIDEIEIKSHKPNDKKRLDERMLSNFFIGIDYGQEEISK